MMMKSIGFDLLTGAVASGKIYLVAAVVGLGVEEATGYPGVVWIAMLVGAFVFREHPQGKFSMGGLRRTLFRGFSAVGVAWAGTGALAEWVGLTSEPFLIAIAALLAGASETIIEHIRHPEKLLALRAARSKRGGYDGE